MKYLFIVVLSLLSFGLMAATMTEISIKEAQKEFTIALDENPTTGYLWAVKKIDKQVLSLTNKTFEKSDKALIGAGGKAIFTFKVLKDFKEKTMLELICKRPWEHQGGKVQSFLIKRVKGNGVEAGAFRE